MTVKFKIMFNPVSSCPFRAFYKKGWFGFWYSFGSFRTREEAESAIIKVKEILSSGVELYG